MTATLVRVGDVLKLERVHVRPDPAHDYVTVGVRSFGKGIFHYEAKAGAELGKLRFFRMEPHRLVVSNIKGWEGAIAVSSDEDEGCLASSRFLTYAPIDDRIDVDWARWFFLSEKGLQLIQRASPGSADRNRTLAIDRFENLEIPLPALPEQRRVADALRRIGDGTRRLMDRVGCAQELEAGLAVSLCARPDVSAEEKSAEGWRILALGSVMSLSNDSVPVAIDASYPNLGIYSFGRGVFDKPPIEGGKTSAKALHRVSAGQFIYSRLFAFEGAYAYVPDRFDGYFVSNEFPSFDPDPNALDARWLATYLRSPERWRELAAASKGLGVRRQRIPVEALLEYEVWLPPIEVQRAMLRVIERLEAAEQSRQHAEQRIKSLLPAALNQMFSRLS